MAHLATLLMVPVEEVTKRHTPESLAASSTHSFACSHFIAAHPRIKPILDGGRPLDTELWHPIAKPHYHLPADLKAAIATLEDLATTEIEIQKDEWILTEIHKLRDACRYAVEHDLAMIVFLSNTLSKPPMRRGPPAQRSPHAASPKQPRSHQARPSGIGPFATARKCFVIGALVFLFGLCLRIGIIFYARHLLHQFADAFVAGAIATDFPVSDALMYLKIGTILSYLLMLAGTGILLLGVARNRRVAASPPPPVN